MNTRNGLQTNRYSRRVFLTRVSALGAAAFLGLSRRAAAEPPPEINKIRLIHAPAICLAPQYLAEELLRAEGFAEVAYVDVGNDVGGRVLASGRADITMWEAPSLLPLLDQGNPIVVLAGIHSGCYELFGNDRVHTIHDLKGKAVVITVPHDSGHVLLSSILAYVGIDPRSEIKWIEVARTPMQAFIDGKADAVLAFAPQPQELRRKKIGHVILNTGQDRPWSQYFCCVVAAHRDFARQYPIAAKRALRALLKAADICAQEPARAARYMADKGYESRYDIGLEVMKELPYRRWREANPEDTLRFHALRLHEVGMIKMNPNKLIAQGTDWRFLNELKKELKA
jgi:NitT/TauT family transport system substrate-binding protein